MRTICNSALSLLPSRCSSPPALCHFVTVRYTVHEATKQVQQDLLKEVEECQRGEYVWRQHGQMVCYSWMDKKPVNLLSTFCDAHTKSTIQRRTGKDLIDVACPSIV